MLVQSVAAILLLAGQTAASADAAAKHPRILKNDFMRAMDTRKDNKRRKMTRRKLSKDFHAEVHGSSKKSSELRKKIIGKSKILKAPGNRKLQNYNNNYNSNYNDATQQQAAEDANAYYGDGSGNDDANAYVNSMNGNGNYGGNNGNYNQYGYNNQNNNGEANYKYNNQRDGADDYFNSYATWENEFGFDVTQFSLSYARCAAVRQYDDEIAADEDTTSVFATKRFAVFRFCPERTCMGWEEEEQEFDCDEDYFGEDYCAYMAEYAQYYEMSDEYNQEQNGDEDEDEDENMNQDQNAWYNNNYGDTDEEEEMYGANGEGCQNNYGEYMMEMDEYLEIMLEWQEERLETYCMYCEDCMFKVYEEWLSNGGDANRKLMSFEDFKASKEHGQLRHLSDQHRELGNYYNVCPEYDTCSEYQNMCGNGMDDSYTEYFECTAVSGNNDRVAYVGPHCAEDGFTITLGIFSDEYCSEWIGNGVNIANFIGEEIDYEEDVLKGFYNSAHGAALDQLKYINEDNVCIPCRKGGLIWEEEGNADDDDDGNYDDSEINELCENVYEVSARCDKHYRSYSNRSRQSQYAEAVAQEDLTCDFIDSVVMGNYNEMGFVNLDENYQVEGQGQRESSWMANNMYAEEYGHYITEVTPMQVFGLLASMLAVGILAVWSMTLHKSLTKKGPWRPRRGFRSNAPANAAQDLSRQNSGIVLGRSASNTSYYMS